MHQALDMSPHFQEDKQPGVCSERTIDLSAWTPWQNRLQEYHKVDHSMQSRHLVELMEFMEVQGEGILILSPVSKHKRSQTGHIVSSHSSCVQHELFAD